MIIHLIACDCTVKELKSLAIISISCRLIGLFRGILQIARRLKQVSSYTISYEQLYYTTKIGRIIIYLFNFISTKETK
jgi:hypothetical protein